MINSCLFVLLFFHSLHCQLIQLSLLNNTRLISLRICQISASDAGIYGGPSARGACNVQKYMRKHNKGICVGFRCLMGWELISLFRLLRLKDALRSTINSKEFFNLNNFKEEYCVLNNNNFLDVLVFDVSCFVLYATMRVLRLADQQTTLMDKHYFFILQTDWI
jgi:hypothetical protein